MDWIDVNDRMPEDEENVLVYLDFGGRKVIDVMSGFTVKNSKSVYRITHWRPLPNPPRDNDASVFLMSNGRDSDE